VEWIWDNNSPLSAVIPAVASISFVGLLILTQTGEQHWQISESSLRFAIAASVVITYLVVVTIVASFVPRRLWGLLSLRILEPLRTSKDTRRGRVKIRTASNRCRSSPPPQGR